MSLARSLLGANPKSSRFPAPKSSATSATYLTADDKRTPRMPLQIRTSQLRRGPGQKVPIRLDRRVRNPSVSRKKPLPLSSLSQELTYRPATLARCIQTETTKVFSSTLKALPGSVVWIRTTRLLVPDSLTPDPGESSYSTIAHDVCFDTDISASTEPLRSVTPTPTPAPSTPYHSAPEPPTSPQSMSSIPTI
jgi:hypothetical protein